MKKVLTILIFILVFSSLFFKVTVFAGEDIITSQIPPVILYSETEKYLRNKWLAPAVPQADAMEVLMGDSYAIWFTKELADAWLQNKTQQNIWGRIERWRARNKLSEGLEGQLQFQFYLKGNPEELRLNEDELYGVEVFLGDDRGNVFEPIRLEKGPMDHIVHKDYYQFTAYFPNRDTTTYEKIIDNESKFVKVALKIRGSKYFFKWDLK